MVEPGGLVTKDVYDGAGRPTIEYTSDGGGDASWSDAGNVMGDWVLNQVETQYDGDGNPILVTNRDRFHDAAATGALGNATTNPKARVSYAGTYYDAADRPTATVEVGTNGGSSYTRPGSVPSRSDTVLVDSFVYNAAGWLDTETDPRGIANKTTYDAKGRIWKTFENYTDGVPTNSSNKTTVYNYDGDAHVVYYEADLPGGAYQKTQYVYNATIAAGNDVTSNDVLVAVKYPDKSTGAPSSSEQETYTVNRLGDTKTLTDRIGTVHTYTFDVLGRQTADAVTTLGSGVDGAVRRLETAFNTQGLAYLFTSYNAASGGSIVNQVQDGFNGLGQLTVEYQAHSGAVNTGTSPKVQYAYTEMAGGANNSRQTSLTYPNGRVLGYTYASGIDTAISRLSSITDGATTLESYSELGLDTIVKRAHPQSTYDQTFIKYTTDSNGDADDKYIGLDRFGRVVDQRWMVSSSGTTNDRYQYGFDRDGNVLYRSNLSNHSMDELYHANGSSNGYDNLGQMTAFLRGTLSDTNSDGVPDTVASNSRSQSWSLDALGNWSSVTTNGTAQTRTANQQNQITSITSLTTPVYDADGPMTTDQTAYP
jgi:hypothetical protein